MEAVVLSLDQMIDQAVGSLPRGRRGKPGAAPSFVREITEGDLPVILASPAPPPAERPMLKIRAQHHLAAKLVAEGRGNVEIGAITGYTPARIVQLKNDPAFQELIAHYKEQVDAKYLNIHERLAALGVMVTEELLERLENAPEEFSNDELRKLAETTLDRGGYGPTAKRELTVNSRSVTMSIVETIKAETQSLGQARTIDNLLEDHSAGKQSGD